jgi:HPt (histidine-containing phosphotransfer) domain-containing protein
LPAIRIIGHNLKGTAAPFGFPDLAAIGQRLEESANRADLADIHAAIRALAEFVSKESRDTH